MPKTGYNGLARNARSTSKGLPNEPPKRNPEGPAHVGSSEEAPPGTAPPRGPSPLESIAKLMFPPLVRLNKDAIRGLHGTRIDCPTCGRPGWLDLSAVPFSQVAGNAVFWSATKKKWECCDERNVNRGPRVVEFDANMRRIN